MEDRLDKIEAYLEGRLPEDEARDMELRMEENPAFKKEVRDYQRIFSGLQLVRDEQSIRGRIAGWEEGLDAGDRPGESRPGWGKGWRWAAAAAGLLLLLSVGYITGVRPYSDSSLYAAYYDDTNTSTATKSGTGLPLGEGYAHYIQGDYPRAIATLSEISDDSPNYAASLYLLSHARMQSAEWGDALASLDLLIAQGDVRYQGEAEWLEALCQLRLGRHGQARQSLRGIRSDSTHAHQNRASQLLDEMDAGIRDVFFE